MRWNSAAKCLIPSTINFNKLNQNFLKINLELCHNIHSPPNRFILQRHFHSFNQDNQQHNWSVLDYIYHRQQLKKTNKKYACLLLNLNDDCHKYFDKFRYIWDEASLKVAVDGSANFLAKRKIIHTADVVCGDFDSVDAELIQQLRSPTKASKLIRPKSSSQTHQAGDEQSLLPQVIETPGQKDTDFTKAIRVALSKRPNIHFFFGLYYSDGSRIDHLFSLVNTLHLVKKNIILVNIQSNTISWLLTPGSHIIHKPRGSELCSLVPFTGPTEVKTQGLVYNIGPGNSTLNFGGLISTSNICLAESDNIDVDTNRELLWSIDACLTREGSTCD